MFVTLGVFHDRGKSEDHIDSTNTTENKTDIYGSGVTLDLSILDQYSIKAVYAKRNNNSPASTSESDPKDDRFWIYGSANF